MAFKLKSPYNVDWTPVYHVDEEDGVNGRANKNGTIILNEDISPAQEVNTISHEMTHVKQFKEFNESNGEKGLDYEDNFITWQGQRMPRRNGKILYKGKWRPEGWPQFPWEKEAYDNEIDIT